MSRLQHECLLLPQQRSQTHLYVELYCVKRVVESLVPVKLESYQCCFEDGTSSHSESGLNAG